MSGPSDTFVIMLRLTSSDMKNIFFFNDTATTEIYTLSLHDALPILCAAVEYRALSLEQAVREMLHGILPALGGDGGLIAVGGDGQIVMDFSTEGMFRGGRDSAGRGGGTVY